MKILIAILVLAIFWVGFCVGNIRMPQRGYDIITVEEAGVILDKAINAHQYYIEYPEHNPEGFTTEFHEGCVERYNQIWELILRLDND